MKLVELHRLAPRPVAHEPSVSKRVLVGPGEVPGLSALQYAVLQPGQSIAAHRHPDRTEIFYAVSGAAQAVVDGQVLELRPGTCLRVDPGEDHAFFHSGTAPFEFLTVGLMPDGLPPRRDGRR